MLNFQNALWDAFPSIQIAEKDVHLSETFERNLVDAFTIQIGPLYDLKPAEALNVAAAVMNYLFERKVRAQLSEGKKVGTEEVFISEILRWQRVIDRGILSGILVSVPYYLPHV